MKKYTPVATDCRGGLSASREAFTLSSEDIALIEHRVFTERMPLDEAVKDFPRSTRIISQDLKAHNPELHKRILEENREIRRERRREITSEPWYNDSCTLFWSPKLLIHRGYLKASGENKNIATSNP